MQIVWAIDKAFCILLRTLVVRKMVNLKTVLCATQNFRKKFILPDKTHLLWYPGHMDKGMKQMQQKLKIVDCLIEVHDARIPFSGRNPNFIKTVSGLRPHILVYNKQDLSDLGYRRTVQNELEKQGTSNVLFTNCKDIKCKGVAKIVPMIEQLIASSSRYNRNEDREFSVMVIGVPNVGKSSLINVLRNKYTRKGSAAAVGAKAGITRSVLTRIKINEDPLIYMLDTPGILTPSVPSTEVGMKLALCATIPDEQVGIELIADYLLFWLNKHGNFRYVDYLGLSAASDSVSEVLTLASVYLNKYKKVKNYDGRYIMVPDLHNAAYNFVEGFRKGLFGQITLDCDMIDQKLEKL